MTLQLPAVDEAYHRMMRRPSSILSAYLLLAIFYALVDFRIMPVPELKMKLTFIFYGAMVFVTTVVYYVSGFQSFLYRFGVLLESLFFMSGIALSMAENPPGLPLLWAFYILLCVVTAQDLGKSPIVLILLLMPGLSLLIWQVLSGRFEDPSVAASTVGGLVLSAGLYSFFGKNRLVQLELTERKVHIERELAVTKTKLDAQEQIRVLDAKWLSILSHMSSVLLIVDENLQTIAIHGTGKDKLGIRAELNHGFLHELQSLFHEAEEKQEPVGRFGLPLRSHDIYVDVRVVALPQERLNERFAVLVQDATSRVKMEQTNAKLGQEMLVMHKLNSVGVMAAGIAHEVNNPLAYIMGNVDYLLKVEHISDTARTSLHDIEEGLRHIQSIVGDLKGFSYNSTSMYRKREELSQIVRTSIRLVQAALTSNATLSVDFPDYDLLVRCQPERIQQVVVNLLLNASQAFLYEGDKTNYVRVRLFRRDGLAVLSVADTGTGMNEETVAKIFDLFFTTKAAGLGTGLGLSIAYSIASDHGGNLTVSSKLGEGTTFELGLPIFDEPEDEAHILIVDDEIGALKLYGRALTRYHVTTAASLAEAQPLFSQDFDAIVSDIRLQDGSGFDIYEMAPPHLQKRFLFYTALPPETPELAECPVGVKILHKPLTLRQIEEEIDAIIHLNQSKSL